MPLIKRFLNGNLFSNLGPPHPARTRIILLTHNYPCINECIIIHINNCSGKRGTGEKRERLIVNSFMTDKQSNRSICGSGKEALTWVPGLWGIICRLVVLTLPSVEDVD